MAKREQSEEGALWMRVRCAGMRALVVGGGKVAVRKVSKLLEAGASVTVVSPTIDARLEAMDRQIAWVSASLEETSLLEDGGGGGYFLVIAATDDGALNERIAKRCEEQGVLVHVVDRGALRSSSVMLPHVSRHGREGQVEVALFLGGASPHLTRMLGERIERLLTREEPWWLESVPLLGRLRRHHLERFEGASRGVSRAKRRAHFIALTQGALQMLREGATSQQVWEFFCESGLQDVSDEIGS